MNKKKGGFESKRLVSSLLPSTKPEGRKRSESRKNHFTFHKKGEEKKKKKKTHTHTPASAAI